MKSYLNRQARFSNECIRLETQIRIAVFQQINAIGHEDKKFVMYDMHDGFNCANRNKKALQWHFKNVTKRLFKDLGIKLKLEEKFLQPMSEKFKLGELVHPIVEDFQSISYNEFYEETPLTSEKEYFLNLIDWPDMSKEEQKSIKKYINEDVYAKKVFSRDEKIPNRSPNKNIIPYFPQTNYKRNSFLLAYLWIKSDYDLDSFQENLRGFLEKSLDEIRHKTSILPRNKTLVRTVVLKDGNYEDVLFEKTHIEQ